MDATTSTLGLNALLATGEPAGGAALDQVVIATGAALVLSAAISWLGMGHRSGKVPYLGRAADFSERVSGLPGWAALPLALATSSLLVALLGMYWDISLHIDAGRDAGPLANPAHYLILAGLFGVFTAGYFAICLPKERPGPAAVHIAGDWYAPVGGLLIAACGAFALAGFPLDDLWHRLFGQDVTLWGPTHLMLFGGASLTLLGQAVLLVEGIRAAPSAEREQPRFVVSLRRIGIMGGFLIGLSTFQGEFDFGVPQFQMTFQPLLIALAAGIGLVCARLWIGRGGAFGAIAFFIVVRGTVSLIVGPLFGETTPHLPLYLAEAACVEAAGLFLVRRPLILAVASGLLIGTVGFAAEYGYSQFAMPLAWNDSLLPAAPLLACVAGVAGALLGAMIALALRGELPERNVSRPVCAGSLVAIAALVANGLITTAPDGLRASVQLSDVQAGGDRSVDATVRMHPRAAADDARWLTATAWQGGGLVVDPLKRTREGVYRTTEPIPVHGDWKAMVRLQTGRTIAAVPIYLPPDKAIPAAGVKAPKQFTRGFEVDKQILQRETKKGVPGWIKVAAPLVVLAIALALVAALSSGLARIGRDEGPRRPRWKSPGLAGSTRAGGARA